MPEADIVRMTARMHNNDPDIYSIMKMIFAKLVREYKGSENGREFLKFVIFGYFSVISNNL
jgi:hypothetical protein